MMEYPLLLRTSLLRAAKYFPKKEVVSVYPNNEIFRYTYADYFKRTCQLAHALESLGVKRGDHVASMALNHHRHLELYFGVPCMGAALHTTNFRLPLHHLVYIINHAEDKVMFVDEELAFIIDAIKDQLKTVKHYVIMSQSGKMPQTGLKPVCLYDDLIAQFPESYDFPDNLSEWDPAMICYTSATTGDPKGVVYSPPGACPAQLRRGLHAPGLGKRLRPAHRPDVPRQRLGRTFRLRRRGLQAGPAGTRDDQHGGHLQGHRRGEGHLHRRRPDDLADALQLPGGRRQVRLLLAQDHRLRRLGLPPFPDGGA